MISFWLGLAAKMATSAVVVVAASVVVERSGPVIGALVATLPVSAGPAYAFLAMEHGPDFLARSTLASLAVNVATAPFILIYAILAQRRGLMLSLGAALAVWFGLAVLLSSLALDFPRVVAVNALSYGSAFLATRRYRNTRLPIRAPSRPWDLPARAATVMSLVLAVILAGRWFGPAAAGIAALAPVVMTSLVLVLPPAGRRPRDRRGPG